MLDQKACQRQGADVSGRFAFHRGNSNSPGLTHVKRTRLATALQLYAAGYVVKKEMI
jgi:hypothetical protein